MILAVGLRMGIWAHESMLSENAIRFAINDTPLAQWIERIRMLSSPILASLAIVTFVCVWIEGFWRPPKSWGMGRWSAAAVSLTLLFIFIGRVVDEAMDKNDPSGPRPFVSILSLEAASVLDDGLGFEPVLGLIACLISARLAGWRGDLKSDATEWFARLLLVATCVVTIGYQFATYILPP